MITEEKLYEALDKWVVYLEDARKREDLAKQKIHIIHQKLNDLAKQKHYAKRRNG